MTRWSGSDLTPHDMGSHIVRTDTIQEVEGVKTTSPLDFSDRTGLPFYPIQTRHYSHLRVYLTQILSYLPSLNLSYMSFLQNPSSRDFPTSFYPYSTSFYTSNPSSKINPTLLNVERIITPLLGPLLPFDYFVLSLTPSSGMLSLTLRSRP